MLCRACEETEARRTRERRGRAGQGIVRETPKPDAAAEGGDGRAMQAPEAQLCTRCGRLLGADDIVRRADQKHSQLAAFGLAGRRKPLLKPTDGEDH